MRAFAKRGVASFAIAHDAFIDTYTHMQKTRTWNSLMAVANAPSASRSRKLVGSSKTRRCGWFHMAAASTSFTCLELVFGGMVG